jgi:hypothetical protein
MNINKNKKSLKGGACGDNFVAPDYSTKGACSNLPLDKTFQLTDKTYLMSGSALQRFKKTHPINSILDVVNKEMALILLDKEEPYAYIKKLMKKTDKVYRFNENGQYVETMMFKDIKNIANKKNDMSILILSGNLNKMPWLYYFINNNGKMTYSPVVMVDKKNIKNFKDKFDMSQVSWSSSLAKNLHINKFLDKKIVMGGAITNLSSLPPSSDNLSNSGDSHTDVKTLMGHNNALDPNISGNAYASRFLQPPDGTTLPAQNMDNSLPIKIPQGIESPTSLAYHMAGDKQNMMSGGDNVFLNRIGDILSGGGLSSKFKNMKIYSYKNKKGGFTSKIPLNPGNPSLSAIKQSPAAIDPSTQKELTILINTISQSGGYKDVKAFKYGKNKIALRIGDKLKFNRQTGGLGYRFDLNHKLMGLPEVIKYDYCNTDKLNEYVIGDKVSP